MKFIHRPALMDAIVDSLLETGGAKFLDITVNNGNYLRRIIEKSVKPVEVYGIDLDAGALERAAENLKEFDGVHLAEGNHADLKKICEGWGVSEVDGVIGDFGLSSDQLDTPERSFSHTSHFDLDMRYSRKTDQTAADLINTSTEKELKRIIWEYGGEKMAAAIAREIIKRKPVRKANELAAIVSRICSGKYLNKSLARVFMAFRVAVNRELEAISAMLPEAFDLLAKGGRLAFLAYDSNEDRLIKTFFTEKSKSCICPPEFPVCICNKKPELRILTPKPVVPGKEEVEENPRSKSARLRIAEKL